jgi:hypothetical protein
VSRGRAASALIVLCLLAAGCGGGQTFTASEFVDRVNEQGVEMTLGRQLQSSGDAEELYAVRLPPLPGEPAAPGAEGGRGASGTLYLFEDDRGAEEQLRACRGSGGLLCFRAANAVVVLEEGGLAARRLALAVRRLR